MARFAPDGIPIEIKVGRTIVLGTCFLLFLLTLYHIVGAIMGKKAEKKLKAQLSDMRSTIQSLVRAGYDAAKTNDENSRHWSAAEDKCPTLMNDRETRRRLRVRARYEADNNCYCSGLVSTLATDVIGYTGPRLRILHSDSGLKTFIETEWVKWSEHRYVNLASKLRILDECKTVEGENFLLPFTDDEVGEETGYALGITNIPANRVTDPDTWGMFGIIRESKIINDDGVIVDKKTGRPKAYKIMDEMDDLNSLIRSKPDSIKAKYIYHWYGPRKSNSYRGYSELTPALPLFAQLRRYGLATLTAAEVAAMLAGVMKTTSPPVAGEPAELKDWTTVPLQRGALISLPDGWDASQFKPEQPISTMEMFVNLILREIGRSLDVPFGIVAGDSSRYNYSSAQLDYRGYEERLKFNKGQKKIRVLNPLFGEWLLELAKNDPRINREYENGQIYYTWTFANRPSSDPVKDATAEQVRLSYNGTTLEEVYAARGQDWEEGLEQRQIETEKVRELGLIESKEESENVPSDD
jgi:capsid protein